MNRKGSGLVLRISFIAKSAKFATKTFQKFGTESAKTSLRPTSLFVLHPNARSDVLRSRCPWGRAIFRVQCRSPSNSQRDGRHTYAVRLTSSRWPGALKSPGWKLHFLKRRLLIRWLSCGVRRKMTLAPEYCVHWHLRLKSDVESATSIRDDRPDRVGHPPTLSI
jgi:hypothetical protein